MLTNGVLLLYDNARPHTAAWTQDLVDSFGWDVIDHLPYNPDLAPNDFHLLLYLKQYLGSKHFDNGEEM